MFRKLVNFCNKFIFNTKQFYFFHYIVLVFLPLIFFLTLSFILSPIETIKELSYDGLALSLNFAIFMYYIVAIIIAVCATIITVLLKFFFARTIFVTSKLLLYNKYYNMLYIYNLIIIIFIGFLLFL